MCKSYIRKEWFSITDADGYFFQITIELWHLIDSTFYLEHFMLEYSHVALSVKVTLIISQKFHVYHYQTLNISQI